MIGQAAAAETEMPKVYNHRLVEERLYEFWEKSGYFTPQIDWTKKPFTIVIPPPNVTGELHHGHAMFISFQDLMIRWRRMQGYPTLWLPGVDHAGIATQNVVEAELAKEGLTRQDLGRERFVEQVWQWKERYGNIITHQLRRLGASCDWTRERFTLDEGLSRAVREAFVRLYNKGLIYRGKYIINWCPRCGTTLSDLEVEHTERSGNLYFVRYPLSDASGGGEGYITVATTRPETILGDTAVAVNPQDQRYASLIGRSAILPIVGRVIPIIADAAVEPNFGTGAVKVTPAHDPTDYEIGLRHHLPAVNVMNPDATMNENAGRYARLDRYACREAILDDLQSEGFLVKVEDYTYAVGRCYRCRTVIEPLISEQWFVRIKPLAEPAIKVVQEGRIRFIPERFSKIYFNWMENIRDWCISRQLWWGHRIPVWYCQDCGQINVSTETPKSCSRCEGESLVQDADVLDTWFSSALWPFSTLGWPDDTEDLRYFYPTDVMETGYDIIFFWVARMIMMGLECTGEIPFRDVYIHGLLRDEKGEKMSKSKGNVADPLDVINRYGADALRFSIITGSSPGNDMKLSPEKLEAARNFANKIWNAARFVVSTSPVGNYDQVKSPSVGQELADRWILSRSNYVIAEATRLMGEYQFGEAGRLLNEFFWGEFCDWYIEISKIRLYGTDAVERRMAQSVLGSVLDTALRLLHPFMPFVTEAIWQHLPQRSDSLMVSPWPQPGERDLEAERKMAVIISVVRAIRNARAEFQIEPARYIPAILVAAEQQGLLTEQSKIITSLARVRPLQVALLLHERPQNSLRLLAGGVEIYLPVEGVIDLAEEWRRLEREKETVQQGIARLEERLANEDFRTRAPADVVEKEQVKLDTQREKLIKLQGWLTTLAEQ
ncbi:MAG: valine--tRNA ligase [Chloroflexi bacterium]|nr:valine--tRNA ligase [Chloroflexota bacterium]MCL5074389.1 valine--tRNA ligase [Chloroflexota bacterium]